MRNITDYYFFLFLLSNVFTEDIIDYKKIEVENGYFPLQISPKQRSQN